MRDAASEELLRTLRETVQVLPRRQGAPLPGRPLAVFLACYASDGPQTVRGLAAALNISKPAVSHALDRLVELRLVERLVDPHDRRSVLLCRTSIGEAFLREIRSILANKAAAAS